MLKVSTRVRYGMRALTQIAAAYPRRSVSVKEIGQEQQVSAKYLEQIVSVFKRTGLVRSVRGVQGGYALTRPPKAVHLSEIVKALEGPPVIVECVGDLEVCKRHATCPTRDVWVRIRGAVDEVLERMTLDDLLENQRSKVASPPASYAI
jgi:Rrf2 family transcriptional regulator, cysteine metabolism repressor